MAVQIKGMDKLIAKLNALGGNTMDALARAVERTTESAKSSAQANIHNVTGDLGRSIDFNSGVVRDDKKVVGTVAANMPYAAHLEFGTYKMSPHPYMMPALNENKPVFEKQAKTELENAIRRTAGGG